MTFSIKRCIVGLLATAFLATPAVACDDLVKLDRAQTIDLLNIVRDDSADPLDQYLSFETLMCADQSGVRDIARRTAADSQNATLRGQVLLSAIMEMESIQIRLLEVEGLKKEQYERITTRPIESLPVHFRDVSKSCLSFWKKDTCVPDAVLSVNGTRVTIRTRFNGQGLDGDFDLKDGTLIGQLTFTKEAQTYPARIDLF